MSDLYDMVADKIQAFCQATYYGNVIASFDQSYDGKEWDHQVEFASFENEDFEIVVFDNDWCEGQGYIRNLKIWHLEDSGEIVCCKDCVDWSDRFQKLFDRPNRTVKLKYCEATERMTRPDFYCAFGERKDDY